MIHESPRFYVGKSSCTLGQEVEKLASSFGCEENCVAFFDNDLQNKATSNSTTHGIAKCSFMLTNVANKCDLCETNLELVQNYMSSVFEMCDSPNKATVVSDLGSQFGTWVSSCVLDYLRDNCPSVNVQCVLRKPFSVIYGLDSYFSLLSAHQALVSANSVIFRGFEDAIELGLQESSSKASQLNDSFETFNRITACDLCLSLAPNDGCLLSESTYTLWPIDCCSHTSKIIDVRSSLYRALALSRDTKRGNRGDKKGYAPLRALAANVHALNNSYATLYSSVLPPSSYYDKGGYFRPDVKLTIPYADLVNISVTKTESRFFHFQPPTQYREHDVAVALGWATSPNFRWPFNKKGKATSTMQLSASDQHRHFCAERTLVTPLSRASSAFDAYESFSSEFHEVSNDEINSFFDGFSSELIGGIDDSRSMDSRMKPSVSVQSNIDVSCGIASDNGNPNHSRVRGTAQKVSSRLPVSSAPSSSSSSRNISSRPGYETTSQHSVNPRRNITTASTISSISPSTAIGNGVKFRDSSASSVYSTTTTGGPRLSSNITSVAGDPLKNIAAVRFVSPYGKQDLWSICSKTKALLQVGAYRHLLSHGTFSYEEIIDALENIESVYLS